MDIVTIVYNYTISYRYNWVQMGQQCKENIMTQLQDIEKEVDVTRLFL